MKLWLARLLIAGSGVLGVSLALGVVAALGAGGFPPPKDCQISGAGILGTLIVFPEDNRGEYTVEIERDGRTLVSSGRNSDHQLARDPSPALGDGEVFRGYHNGELVLGPDRGEGYDCGGDTTVPPTTTPPVEPPTTTLPPDDGPAPGPKPPKPTPPTTTQPPFTPPVPDENGNCAEGFQNAGAGVCLANEEGG